MKERRKAQQAAKGSGRTRGLRPKSTGIEEQVMLQTTESRGKRNANRGLRRHCFHIDDYIRSRNSSIPLRYASNFLFCLTACSLRLLSFSCCSRRCCSSYSRMRRASCDVERCGLVSKRKEQRRIHPKNILIEQDGPHICSPLSLLRARLPPLPGAIVPRRMLSISSSFGDDQQPAESQPVNESEMR